MKKFTPLIFLLAAAVLISGCIGQQNQQASGDNQNPPQANGEIAVMIKDFSFQPSVLGIGTGTTVRWTNEDSAPHNIKADAFSSEILNKGDSFVFKFEKSGIYDYICSLHPAMKGQIRVIIPV